LLDHLGVDSVAIVAMSDGGPSALLFAVLHPERVSSLTLVSCGVAPSSSPDQAQADRKGEILTSIFTFDFPYWAVSKLAKRQFMALMGANPHIPRSRRHATALSQRRVRSLDYSGREARFLRPWRPRRSDR
jgi:pimeloyl-ACP methyl ester carboxylesterase